MKDVWTDNETAIDYLNFSGVAETVAELIERANARPISIGIAGAWGVGKSSMIQLVQRALTQRDSDGKKFLFVTFNAWLYQGYDDARAALMDVIGEALRLETEKRKTGIDKTREFVKRVRWSRVVKFTAAVGAIAAGLPPPTLFEAGFEAARKVLSGGSASDDVEKLEGAAKKVGDASGGFLSPKEEYSPPQEIDALRASFEAALKELDVTLVVLIDDLDRCLPETTISTLEAIRLFLFLPRTAFVLAADDQMIRHAVRKHFSGIDDELVTNYFDKLIQIAIRVPPLGTAEVRAYMMLLYVENSQLHETVRERLRSATIAQLRQSWQGKRVNLAFFQGLKEELPPDLLVRLESADRLAPIMATATRIQGNPRLIKRFLNMLTIRMTIARGHGVTVDEGIVTKMLLLERCAPPKAFSDIATAVMKSVDGRATVLQPYEEAVKSGKGTELSPPWNDPFLQEWLTLPPVLGNLDLRGVLYVSREHAPLITPEDRLSPEAASVLSGMLDKPAMAGTAAIRAKLPQLSAPDRATIMQALLARARQEQAWGAPDILTACLALADADAAQSQVLTAFLMGIPPTQLQPSIVPKIAGRSWTNTVYDEWKNAESLSKPMRGAISQQQSVH
jgi:predicted KAP-like P-loop ATPase